MLYRTTKIGKKRHLMAFSGFAMTILATQLSTSPAYSSSNASLLDDKKPTGSAMLDKIYAHVAKYKDYKFHSAIKTYKGGGKPNNLEGDFYFKKAKNVRIEVTSGGMKKGSIVVRNSEGIKAKTGGGLLSIKLTLTPDSRMLVAPNGFNVVDSDLETLLSGLKERAARGMVIKSSDGPIPVPGLKGNMLVVEVIQPKPTEKVVERICVNPAELALIHWEIFKQDQLFSTFEVADFKGNLNLDEKLFTM